MQVLKIDANKNKNNLSFNGERIPKRPIKKVSEETLKKVSAAITATGVASLMLGEKCEDYTKSIALNFERAKLDEEAEKALKDAFETAPPLVDLLISTKDKRSSIRDISAQSINAAIEAYETDPDLTEKLIEQKNNDGCFKYTILEVNKIVQSYKMEPLLHDWALKYPTLVYNLLTKVNENNVPVYSIDDIIHHAKAYDINLELAQRLTTHKYKDEPRFEGKDILFAVQNNDKFMRFLLEQPNRKFERNNSHFQFHKDEIKQIYNLCDTEDKRNFAKNLINKTFSTNNKKDSSYLSNSDIIMILESTPSQIAYYINNKYHDKSMILNILSEIKYDIHTPELKKIMEMRSKNGEKALFTLKELSQLSAISNFPIIVKCMSKNFSLEETEQIIKESKKFNSEIIEKLLNGTHRAYVKENKSIKASLVEFEYEKDDILTLLQLYHQSSTLLEKLLDLAENEQISTKDSSVSKTITELIKTCFELYHNSNESRDDVLKSSRYSPSCLNNIKENLKNNQRFTQDELKEISYYKKQSSELTEKLIDAYQIVNVKQKTRVIKKKFKLEKEDMLEILRNCSEDYKLTLKLLKKTRDIEFQNLDIKNLSKEFASNIINCYLYAKENDITANDIN